MPILARVLVWGVLFLSLFILRSFFLLIFLTFIFAYIQSQGVDRLMRYINRRTPCVVLSALILLGVIIGLGQFLVPRVREQAQVFIDKLPSYLRTMDEEVVNLANSYPMLEHAIPHLEEYRSRKLSGAPWTIEHSLSGDMLPGLLGFESDERGEGSQSLDTLKKGVSQIVASVSAFLLSLLFSFLIVLDLPRLTASIKGLKYTKIGWVYDEMSETISGFGAVLGRAFEAQMYIAFVNTLLTAIGIYMIGIGEKVAFLSVLVFLCSFIPVAGVFISSVPICLIALQISGFKLMLLAILLITVIHMIEAYVLNPKIYGHHMHMNPVIVLIILTIGGKLFHVWGLILGVPICTYIFGHAIRMGSQERKLAVHSAND